MISVVIPFFNEEEGVKQMASEVSDVLGKMDTEYEILAVDDGSIDNTLVQLEMLKAKLNQLRIISFSRNFGLQAALTAGMEYAKGEYIVLIDGDMQDPPELIQKMYERIIESKADIVIGKRKKRNEQPVKRLAIKSFHFIFDKVSGLDDIYNTGNFCLMRNQVANAILSFNESTRYIPGVRSFVGFKREYIEYERPDRSTGEAKMNTKQLFALATDAIFSFSKWPIKICLWLGLMGIFLLLIAGIYSILSKALGWAPLGWSSTILSLYFIGTIQLTFLGVFGEYLYRIYKEVQKRPLYIIRKHID